MKRVRVTVPASSANLGPGFDCIGLALSLYHTLTVTERPGPGHSLDIHVTGEGADLIAKTEKNAVYRAMLSVSEASGVEWGHLEMESHSEIPMSSGLGSSAAAVLAGLAAGSLLTGRALDHQDLLRAGLSIEGHSDNVVPSLLGGFAVACAGADGSLDFIKLDVPAGVEAVVAVPDFRLSTADSRRVLPEMVAFDDAVRNHARVALLTAAMASGKLDFLRTAMADCLHQPYRIELVPGFDDVRDAALEAGAIGAALSGAGPAVIALVRAGEDRPGPAMQEAWRSHGITSRVITPSVDRDGLRWSLDDQQEELG